MTRIFFVDDDPLLLKGLERMLFGHDETWEVEVFSNGNLALAAMEECPADILVTDMRMPGMDGAELLRLVHDRFPQTARIVLSGYMDLSAALRGMPVAHQYLTKPCDAPQLIEVLERAQQLRSLVEDTALRAALGTVTTLPVQLATFRRLTVALDSPKTTLEEVARIIAEDFAIAANVLHLANSAFFANRTPACNVADAVRRLGLDLVRGIALTTEAFGAFSPPQVSDFSLDQLRDHCFHAAIVAHSLAQNPRQAAEASLAAMLHDVGALLFATFLPEHFERSLRLQREHGTLLHKAEREVSGVTHADLGAYLLGLWGLPQSVVHAVLSHHSPELLKGHGWDTATIVLVADRLVGAEIGSVRVDDGLTDELLRDLGITESAENLRGRTTCSTSEGRDP